MNKIFKNDSKINKNEVVRKLLNILVTDLIENSQNKINLANIKNIYEALMGDLSVRELPIFPLPEVVLFPQEVLPLHIFESRYRLM